MRAPGLYPVLLFAALLLPACSKSPEAPDAPAEPGAASGAAEAEGDDTAIASALRACDLITAEAMSTILATPMKADPDDGAAGKTSCLYMPVEGVTPYAIVTVARGDADAAMAAMGTAGQIEPGLANPYEGIGDEAFAVGEMLNIRRGQDLVQITLSGVDDVPAKARAIYDAASAGLR